MEYIDIYQGFPGERPTAAARMLRGLITNESVTAKRGGKNVSQHLRGSLNAIVSATDPRARLDLAIALEQDAQGTETTPQPISICNGKRSMRGGEDVARVILLGGLTAGLLLAHESYEISGAQVHQARVLLGGRHVTVQRTGDGEIIDRAVLELLLALEADPDSSQNLVELEKCLAGTVTNQGRTVLQIPKSNRFPNLPTPARVFDQTVRTSLVLESRTVSVSI